MSSVDPDALFGHLRELLERTARIEERLEGVGEHGNRLSKLEIKQAKLEGAVSVLKWAIPGGPALVTLIGLIAIWARG